MESINGSRLKVRIVQASACAACSAKSHCHVSESKEKMIDVYNKQGLSCAIGEKVWVVGTSSMSMKAVLLAFVIPFLVVVLSLVIALRLTGNEAGSALICLCALIPYYLIIYMCRHKL